MGRFKGEGRITTSVTISPMFFELAKQHHISFTEALRVGLALIFAEKGIADYDNSLNIFRKMQILNKKLEETSQELFNLKEKWETQTTSKEEKKNIK